MSCSPYYLIIYAIISLLCIELSIAGSNDTDRVALLKIKSKINDPLGALSSWNDSLHFCNWNGVTCGLMHQRVRTLDLGSLKLSGSLSPYIGNLSFLRNLLLQNNTFGGIIPPEIGLLHRLENLTLANNTFHGEIPLNITGWYRLIKLKLGNNKLVGTIPNVFGSMLNLQFLSFYKNNLTGNIPSSLGNVSSLSHIALESCNLVGSIPNSFGRLNKLTFLNLAKNRLSGLVPSSIFNLSRLTILDFRDNDLTGSLPSDIGVKLPLLTWLSISDNSFSGLIPTSLSNLSNLEVLQMSLNNLRGNVPSLEKLVNLSVLRLRGNSLGDGGNDDLGFFSSLRNATLLYALDISQNNFGGIFPQVICNITRLSSLDLQANKIAGNFPICIDNLANLQIFSIAENQISGVIPQNLGKLHNIHVFLFYSNRLSGHIPSSIGNLTKLSLLYLGENNLVGQIPSSIGNCVNLLRLDTSHNNLNGSIPSEILSRSSLLTMNLSNNHLTGTLNAEVGQLTYLLQLDVSSNMLLGEIPPSLSTCVELELLNLQDNLFVGDIPNSLKTLRSLQQLNLSRNNLSGKIPDFLVSLPLKNLNLAYNNFNGEVPVGGVFGNVSGISTAGNSMLCGGKPALNLPKCRADNTTAKISNHRKKIIFAMILGFLSVITLVMILLLCRILYKKRSRKYKIAIVTTNSLSNLSYQSLLKATNGFASDNVIGNGSFGVVYKGIIDIDETLIAIKVFKLERRGASKSFTAECEVLRNIRHRNLVKVITVCSSTDYQGNDFKALVYEYMVNGSLEDWLHPNRYNQSLNFHQRLNIAIDVAFGMEYLHHGYGASVVHCDLKPSNILLDELMVAHVADFGLAKFLSISQTFQSSSLGLRGTIGYAPPEYGLGNGISTSGDVYSFGILLMEMITGKRPTSNIFRDGLSLHNWVQAALPEQVTEILDSALLESVHNDNSVNRRKMMLEALISMLQIALSCSSEHPQERLDMEDVASKLSAIRNRFIRT